MAVTLGWDQKPVSRTTSAACETLVLLCGKELMRKWLLA